MIIHYARYQVYIITPINIEITFLRFWAANAQKYNLFTVLNHKRSEKKKIILCSLNKKKFWLAIYCLKRGEGGPRRKKGLSWENVWYRELDQKNVNICPKPSLVTRVHECTVRSAPISQSGVVC